MPYQLFRAAPSSLGLIATLALACTTKPGDATNFNSESGGTGSGSGDPGAPCESDADCPDGACMAAAFLPDTQKICGPACMVDADCEALAEFDYAFEVDLASPTLMGNNVWNSTVLSRGRSCTAGSCQFQCPAYAAAVLGADGVAAGCACLPHFAFDVATGECAWDPTVECAALERSDETNPCDVCNSDPLFEGCNSGRFQCQLDTASLNGECVEWAMQGEEDLCAMGTLGYDCNPACFVACAANDCTGELCNVDITACSASCCEETDTPMPPQECDPDPTDGGGGENTPDQCIDGNDNDMDGFTDCHPIFPDHDCCGVGVCGCNGGCSGVGLCMQENTPATCVDGMDNDGDGAIDCDESFPEPECCGVAMCECSGACEGLGMCAM